MNMNSDRADIPDTSVGNRQTRRVRWGDTVQVAFMAWLEDGTLVDSSIGNEPPTFTAGTHSVMQGIDRLVIGMSIGESKTEKIPQDSAFGLYRPELSCRVSRRWFEAQNIEPKVGLGLEVRKKNGTLVDMMITGLNGNHVTLDANHPLAGKNLLVQLDLLEIVDRAGSDVPATSTLDTWRKRQRL